MNDWLVEWMNEWMNERMNQGKEQKLKKEEPKQTEVFPRCVVDEFTFSGQGLPFFLCFLF